jgi:hypothetical protein
MAIVFFKDDNTAPKLTIRVASEQRISKNKLFCSTIFYIDGHKFTNLHVRVLPHFKGSDIILELQALRKLNVITLCFFYYGKLQNTI